jgi:hypothetical protein
LNLWTRTRGAEYSSPHVFGSAFRPSNCPSLQATSVADLLRVHEDSSPSRPSTLVGDIDPLVERVIVRCLERDPRLRPKSALAIAAQLPGGDPVAAALAAGENAVAGNGGGLGR